MTTESDKKFVDAVTRFRVGKPHNVSASFSNELLCEDNSPFPMKKALFDLAAQYEKEAEHQKDKFNKGYFEGKAEMARLVINCLGVDDRSLIRDILNGDA